MSKKSQSINIDPKDIRNFSIISHVDHGKTTLSDHIMTIGNFLPEKLAGTLRALDFLPEEQKRGITIESSLLSFTFIDENHNMQFNLIDTPGHVDFSGKVAESLRLVDGSIIIVDAVEGIMAQTKTVLRQAIREKIKVILFINKIDRLINELQLSLKNIQLKIEKIISEIRQLCLKFGLNKEYLPNFEDGNVIIGSALHGWAIDNELIQYGVKFSDIINMYKKNESLDLPDFLSIKDVLKRVIITKLPNPIQAQNFKFPSLISNHILDKEIEYLKNCDNQNPTIVSIGRLFRITNLAKTAYTIRILSGKINTGNKLKSSFLNKNVKILRIISLHGRTTQTEQELNAGQIGGIILSNPIPPGDILVSSELSVIRLINISYVQEPVVGIGIEPIDIGEISRLQETIENIVQTTPGLQFEVNNDTGELIALGVGNLQLDILKNDLKSLDFNIETSEPMVLFFEIPTKTVEFVNEKWENNLIQVGISSSIKIPNDNSLLYEDKNKNYLIMGENLSMEFRNGMTEVFRQFMKSSPNSKKRIKNFFIKIKKLSLDKDYQTYEYGMIIGASFIKDGLTKSNSCVHEPFYLLEISTPEMYLGNIIQVVLKSSGTIDDVSYDNNDVIIQAEVPVKSSFKLADELRQESDGNAFWSYPSTQYLPSINQN